MKNFRGTHGVMITIACTNTMPRRKNSFRDGERLYSDPGRAIPSVPRMESMGILSDSLNGIATGHVLGPFLLTAVVAPGFPLASLLIANAAHLILELSEHFSHPCTGRLLESMGGHVTDLLLGVLGSLLALPLLTVTKRNSCLRGIMLLILVVLALDIVQEFIPACPRVGRFSENFRGLQRTLALEVRQWLRSPADFIFGSPEWVG